jgi:hypothetical protein
MTLLASLFEGLTGKFLTTITAPLLGLLALIFAHNWSQERDELARKAAIKQCDASWEVAIRKEERDAATRQVGRAQSILEGERNVNEGLRNELQQLHNQYASLRAQAAASTDQRCLSDGVLNALGGNSAVDGKAKGGGRR